MILKNEHLTRQLDLIPIQVLGTPVTIIGAGAIGGWTALALAKMGFSELEVWDDDSVDIVNMNSQLYRFSDIGKPKVEALAQLVEDFTDVKIVTVRKKYTGERQFPGVVIAAVDSMAARKMIWEAHKEKSPQTKAIIDPRMGAETALLYVFSPMLGGDIAAYEKSLYIDSQAVQERCTAKATIYTANMLSGLVCKAVKDLTTRPDYLRTAQWDIAANEFFGFKQKVH